MFGGFQCDRFKPVNADPFRVRSVRQHRCEREGAKLCPFPDDKVERGALYGRNQQLNIGIRFRRAGSGRDCRCRGLLGDPGEPRAKFAVARVEQPQFRASLAPQHIAQVMRLLPRESDRSALFQSLRREEPGDHRRALTNAEAGPTHRQRGCERLKFVAPPQCQKAGRTKGTGPVMDIGALLLFYFILVSLQPLVQQRALEMMRRRKLSAIEQERASRVILMAHRQETMRLLGFPIVQYINMNDTEEVIHAIRMTDPDMPLDVILHTPGGVALAAIQIARAVKEHRGRTTVFVPHYAMSGGTLIALAADEIVLGPHAVLGPIDPQIDGYPAAAIIEAAERKPVSEVDDSTLILESVSRRAVAQLRAAVLSLLSDSISDERKEELAGILTTGLWTHDYGITATEAAGMGLPVSTELPSAIYDLMRLFPQPLRKTPSVEYLPFRHEPTQGK